MPDPSQLALLVLIGVPVAVLVALPFGRHGVRSDPAPDRDLDALAVRRKIAYDALRDLDVDFRARNLHVRQYLRMRGELEERAARALAELETAAAASDGDWVVAETRSWRVGRRLSAGVAGIVALALLVGFALPEPLSFANGTVVNEPLAAALANENARLAEIQRLLRELQQDGDEPSRLVLSDLADAYLAGSTQDDLAKGALVLLALIQLQPDQPELHARIITAYLRAGDYDNARKATDALEELAPESIDVAFFRGLIALRGSKDRAAAVEAFDEFLQSAPDDPRAAMVRSLRAEAASEVPPGS